MEIWDDLASFYGKLLVIALILKLLPANLIAPPEPGYCELGKAPMKSLAHPESAAAAHN